MISSTLIGTIGVTILLVAFFLNLFNFIKPGNKIYILMNFIGAGLSCYASVLINYIPFIILEGTWSFVAMIALIKFSKN